MSQDINSLKYICMHCSKKFKYESEKNRHEKSHKPQYDCKVCQKTFSFLYALRRHQKQHERSEPVTCTKCGRTFKDEILLQRHLKYSHSGLSFRCAKCNIKFSSDTALKAHSKVHKVQRQKQFKCSFKGCQKSFNFSIHLKHHEFTHTGTKQYYCHICGKGFIQEHHLKTHLKSHEPEKWIRCTVSDCNKKFSNEYALKRHKNTHERNGRRKLSRDNSYADVEHIGSSISNDEDSHEKLPVVEDLSIKIEIDLGESMNKVIFDVSQSKKLTNFQKLGHIQDDIMRTDEINGCTPSNKSLLSCHENDHIDSTNMKIENNYKTFCDVKYVNILEENFDNCNNNESENIIDINRTMLFDSVMNNNISCSGFDNDCRSVLGVCLTSGDGTPDEDCLCAKINKGKFPKNEDLKIKSNNNKLSNGTSNCSDCSCNDKPIRSCVDDKNREFNNDFRSTLGVCLTSDEDYLYAKINKGNFSKNEVSKTKNNNNNLSNYCSDCSCNDGSIRSCVDDKKRDFDNDCRSVLGVCLTSGDGTPDANCLCAKISKNERHKDVGQKPFKINNDHVFKSTNNCSNCSCNGESINNCEDSEITNIENQSVIYNNMRDDEVMINGFL